MTTSSPSRDEDAGVRVELDPTAAVPHWAPPLVPIRPPVKVLPPPPPATAVPPVDPAALHPPLPPHPHPRKVGHRQRLSAGPALTVVVWLLALVAFLLLLL